MKRRSLQVIVAALGCWAAASAMDGFSIANIQPFKSYTAQYTEGTLVRYDIKDNYVVNVDTLNAKGCSPSINMSGTFYAYLTTAGGGKKIVVRNIQGDAGYEIPVKSTAVWLWWTADGSFYYTDDNWFMRKVTVTRQNGVISINDRLWAIFGWHVQGGFVDMSMVGDRVVQKSYDRWKCTSKTDSVPYGPGGCEIDKGSGGSVMTGDTTKVLDKVVNVFGCGFGVSPSGWFFTNWPGGHTTNGMNIWNASEHAEPTLQPVSHDTLNAKWAVYRSTDPEANLERLTQFGWKKTPIGSLGCDNGWSCNGLYWALSEITMADNDGRPTNQIAIDFKNRIAINVTKIMPPAAVPADGEGGQFRGITFTGVSRWAERGDLWCSTRADVWDQLWTYVENRSADNQKWADLFGIPAADLNGSVAALPGTTRFSASRPNHSNNFVNVRVYDLRGRLAVQTDASGVATHARGLAGGLYLVRTGSHAVPARAILE